MIKFKRFKVHRKTPLILRSHILVKLSKNLPRKGPPLLKTTWAEATFLSLFQRVMRQKLRLKSLLRWNKKTTKSPTWYRLNKYRHLDYLEGNRLKMEKVRLRLFRLPWSQSQKNDTIHLSKKTHWKIIRFSARNLRHLKNCRIPKNLCLVELSL